MNRLEIFLEELLDGFKPYRGYAMALCPYHHDRRPSLRISLSTGRFSCYACREVGSLPKLVAKVKGLSLPEARDLIKSLDLTEKKYTTPEEEYLYTDAHGFVLFKVTRYSTPQGKTFRVFHYDYDREKWISGKGEEEEVLYNLPDVLGSDVVIVVEGEKDVECLRGYGFVGTTNPFGAGKWKPEYAKWLEGKVVYLVPDNDEPGVTHMREVAETLQGKAREILWVDLSGLVPEGGDITDLISKLKEEGKGEEDIRAIVQDLLNQAKPYTPDRFSLLNRLSLQAEELENVEAEYLMEDFLPKGALILFTAKYGGGKSLTALALSKRLLKKGAKVIYLDMDNSLPVVAQRLQQAELLPELGKNFFYFSRAKMDLHFRAEAWKELKREIRDAVVVVDTLKNFARGVELNSDRDMGAVMSELMDLRDRGNTVLILHHVPKLLNPAQPFKNSGTIVDSVDVAYELVKDDNSKITFRAFKDRIPIKSSLTFEITEDFELKPSMPIHLQEEISICEEILRSIPLEGKKRGDLVSVVKDRTGIGKHKVEDTLTKYEGVLWEVVRASRNAKIYQRKIDPYQFSKNPSLYIGRENWETKEPQGLEASQPEKTARKTRKLNGDNDLKGVGVSELLRELDF